MFTVLASTSLMASALAGNPAPLQLLSNAQADGKGVFLSQVISDPETQAAMPPIRLGDPPAYGRLIKLTQTQIRDAAQKAAPSLASATWAGAETVTVSRRSRLLGEAEFKEQLTALLQREHVREKGELELRLTRGWTPISIPDDPIELKILDLPNNGVSPNFIVRFELSAAGETIGAWQAAAQARVWRELWVARATLKPGQVLEEGDLIRERRDVLGLRESIFDLPRTEAVLELAEMVPAGAPLSARSVRLRPVVRRGQLVEAQLLDGGMMISLKVEVLENGAPGQLVRIRNPQSKREFRGRVQNEQTILVIL